MPCIGLYSIHLLSDAVQWILVVTLGFATKIQCIASNLKYTNFPLVFYAARPPFFVVFTTFFCYEILILWELFNLSTHDLKMQIKFQICELQMVPSSMVMHLRPKQS